MSKLQIFSLNTNGRDFICSDIHGNFSLLEIYLSREGFDPARDRLFCLGDLIDRGDESYLAIDYLKKPWFFSILGNHELMLIDAVESQNADVYRQWYFWGGDWAEDLDSDTLQTYYEALVSLPMAIELELQNTEYTRTTRVGLVHAELPAICDWADVREELNQMDNRNNSTGTRLTHCMLWNKDQALGEISHEYIEPVEGIDHVFHGHTILDTITTIGNRTFIDLGSYKTGMLGVVDPQKFLCGKKRDARE